MSMFNWSGKQSLQDEDDIPQNYSSERMGGGGSGGVSGSSLEAFDHTFKGEIHTIAGDNDKLAVFGNCQYEHRSIRVVCSANTFEIIEEVSLSKIQKTTIPYKMVTGVSWDHATSEVKIELISPDDFIIMTLTSSVEFERELRLRFAKIAGKDNFRIPSPMYMGIFAGTNKPKPFQRKRPNLSNLPNGKLPSLKEMRHSALELRVGSYRPCPAGESRRMQLSYQHIYEGFNTFKLTALRGKSELVHMFNKGTSLLFIMEDKLIFRPQGAQGTNIEFAFEDIASWTPIDHDSSSTKDSGIEIESTEGDQVYFGSTYIRDIKHTLEYFWNKFQTSEGRGPILGSTHGRPLVSITTLSGEVQAQSIPSGSSEVVDIDGIIVRPGGKMALRSTTASAIKGMMGTVEEPRFVPPQNPVVAKHWNKVVLHQGWLLKQGGVGVGSLKSWIKRYFVLYRTSQGHFLVYYGDFTESPLYTTERNQRNVVDLAKATYIRPGSEDSDAPNHSFDIVTIERQWTLCAETQDNLQRWMKVLTHACDEDVAILPDEEIRYSVKPKQDPSGILPQADYSTTLKVSAHGVSVTIPHPGGAANPEKEVFFWVYTDFFKWSLVVQNEKPALSVTVFTDAHFSKKVEYQFRHKDAAKIATAIEFFIEKFMSVQHIRLELTDPEAISEAPSYSAPVTKRAAPAAEKVEKVVYSPPPAPKEVDLLGFDDEDFSGASISPAEHVPVAAAYIPLATPIPTATIVQSVDIFGDNPFSAPSPPAATTAASDPFGSDPFGDPFSSAPSSSVPTISMLPALTPDQLHQQRVWWLGAIVNSGGPIYDDSVLQIASKVEVRGSQARVTLFYRNISDEALTSFSTSISDPNSFLRYDLAALSPELPAGGQVEQLIMVECIHSVCPGALLQLEYITASNAKRVTSLELPLAVTSFDEPLALNAADFLVRWNALVNPGQEHIEVFDAPNATPALAHKVLTAASKFQYVSGLVDTAAGVAGSSTLRMGSPTVGEKVNVGCLLKIEVSSGKVRVTARTTAPAASSAIVASVKRFILQIV